jgi:hypothetical protein
MMCLVANFFKTSYIPDGQYSRFWVTMAVYLHLVISILTQRIDICSYPTKYCVLNAQHRVLISFVGKSINPTCGIWMHKINNNRTIEGDIMTIPTDIKPSTVSSIVCNGDAGCMSPSSLP